MALICGVVRAGRWGYEYAAAAERGHLASVWSKGDSDGNMTDDNDRDRWRQQLERGWGWGTMASASCSGDEASDLES